MAQKAYIDIIDIDTQTLLDSKRNDIAFYTLFGSQNILMSAGSNVYSKLCITSNNIGIGTVNPRVKLDIQSTDAIQVPAGTSADRSNFSSFWNNGQIRYNTNIQQFEGYANNTWAVIGGAISGVIDNNNDTYISAETSPGINNDQLQFYTSNINRMIIDKNGYVGIGTTIPGEKLHIYSSNARIRLQDTITSNNTTTLDFYNSSNINGYIGYLGTSNLRVANTLSNAGIKFHTNNIEQIIFDNIGNIGINTMSPGEKMHIYSSNARIRLQDTITSNNTTTIDFYNSSNINGYIGYLGTSNLRIANTLTNGSIKLYTSNAEQIIFNNTGNIGINTMSPGEKLHIYSSNAKIRIQDTQSNNITSKIDFYNLSNLNGFIGYFGSQDLLLNNSALSGSLRLYTNNTEKLTINSNGFVGIGNSIPNAKLEVNHNTTTPALLITNGDANTGFTNQTQIAFSYAGTNTYNHFIHTRHFGGSANNAIDFYVCNGTANNTLISGSTLTMSMNGGNVGIGTTNPSSALHVYGALNSVPPIAGVHIGFEQGLANRPGIEFCASDANGDVIIDFTTLNVDSIGRIYYNFSGNYMSFNTSAVERARFDSTGLVLGINQSQQLTFNRFYGAPGSVAGTKINIFPITLGATSVNDMAIGTGINFDFWYNVGSTYKHSFTVSGTEIAAISSGGITSGSTAAKYIPRTDVNNTVIKYGNTGQSSATSGSVSFGYTFTTGPKVVLSIDDNSGVTSYATTFNISTTGFTWYANGGDASRSITWIAIGIGPQ
jgi:hypothetical protein